MRPRPGSSLLAAALSASLACATGTPHGAPKRSPGPHLARDVPAYGGAYRCRTIRGASGLRASAIELEGAPSLALSLSYTLAGLDDPPGREGLREVAALVAWRGGAVRGGLRVGERLFAAGALSSFQADADALRVTVRARPGDLRAVLGILADWARDPASGIEEDEVEQARRILSRRAAAPPDGDHWRAELARAALAGSRHATRASTESGLAAISARDVRELLARAVRPERAVVVGAGPTRAEDLLRIAEFHLAGPDPRSPVAPVDAAPAAPAVTPRAPGGELRTATGSEERDVLWIAWPLPGVRGGHELAGSVTATILRDVLGARAARPDLDPLVTWLSAEHAAWADAGLLRVRAGLSEEGARRAGEVRAKLAEEAEALGRRWTGDHSWAVEEWKGWLRWSTFRSLQLGDLSGLDLRVRDGSGDPIASQENEISGVSSAIPRLLQAHVRADTAVALLVARAPAPEPGRTEAAFVPPWGRAPDLRSIAAPGAAEVGRLVPPPGLDRAVRRRLDNGVEVLVLPRDAFPSVHVALHVRDDLETPEASDTRTLAIRALALSPRWRLSGWSHVDEGVAFVDAGPAAFLAHYLARVGAWTWSPPRLRRAAELVSAARDGEGRGDPAARESMAWRAIHEALAKPASAPIALTNALAALDPDATLDGFSSWFRPDRATLVVTGKVSPGDAFWNDVQDAFGSWRAEGPAPEAPPPGPGPERRRVLLFDHPGAVTGSVRVLFRVPHRGARDEGAFLSLVAHLHDVASGVAAPVGGRGALAGRDGLRFAFLGPSFEGARAELPGATESLLEALDRLRARPISGSDLDFARWNAARWMAFAHDGDDGAAATLASLALHGLPASGAEATGAALAATTPATVHALSRSVLGREVVVISGDAATLAPALAKLGLTPEILRFPEGS